jgi:hypothetical protein
MHSRKYTHAAETCDVIVVNSEFTAREVVELLGFPRERISVAYPGIGPSFGPNGASWDLGGPFVLTVATLERRKNLETLLAAMKLVRRRRPELRLAVVGAPGWQGPSLEADGVLAPGYVDDDELAALYRGAEVFVRLSVSVRGLRHADRRSDGLRNASHRVGPSFSRRASGDVALRAEPEDPEAFAAEIERAIDAGHERARAGLEHADRFSARGQGEAVLRAYELARGSSRTSRGRG